MTFVPPKSAKLFLSIEALKFKFLRGNNNIIFVNVSLKMNNNRIWYFIVDHFIIKQKSAIFMWRSPSMEAYLFSDDFSTILHHFCQCQHKNEEQ